MLEGAASTASVYRGVHIKAALDRLLCTLNRLKCMFDGGWEGWVNLFAVYFNYCESRNPPESLPCKNMCTCTLYA